MICNVCEVAGDFNARAKYKLAEAKHEECKGDCTCLHKTGAGWYVKAGGKAPLIQVQSP